MKKHSGDRDISVVKDYASQLLRPFARSDAYLSGHHSSLSAGGICLSGLHGPSGLCWI